MQMVRIEKKGTKDNYTHIRFHYDNHRMTVNKFTHIHVYPNAHIGTNKVEYLIVEEK